MLEGCGDGGEFTLANPNGDDSPLVVAPRALGPIRRLLSQTIHRPALTERWIAFGAGTQF